MYSCINFKSPLGDLIAMSSETALVMLDFADAKHREKVIEKTIATGSLNENNETEILRQTKQQIEEYFAGSRKTFSIPIDPRGTHFQKEAWRVLQDIPYGETRSYKEEAIALGNPQAVRAVGGANNQNPLLIIIPCHRVIGSDGKLIGYGGGIERKQWLLEWERNHL